MANKPNSAPGTQSHPAKSNCLPPAHIFIGKLLAPLPEGEEQADSEGFRRVLRQDRRRDLKDSWRRAQLHVRIAEHKRAAAGFRHTLAREFGEGNLSLSECRRLHREFVDAVEAMMHCPAPDVAGLRWKRKWRKLDGGRDAWEAAIAADAAWLEAAA